MLPAGGFAEPFGIDKSSRPWRQILPQAKFPRQLHLHPAVTYVHVSSLGCKFASLGGFAEPFGIVKSSRLRRQILPLAKFPCLRAFSTLCQSVDFVNILSAKGLRPSRALLWFFDSETAPASQEARPFHCPCFLGLHSIGHGRGAFCSRFWIFSSAVSALRCTPSCRPRLRPAPPSRRGR